MTPTIQSADFESLYPYLCEHISFRLARELVQFRDLSRDTEVFVNLRGSAYPFIKELTGLVTVGDILTKMSGLFPDVDAGVLKQDYTDMLVRLTQENVVVLSNVPVDKRKCGLGIVASELRSSVHFDITHKCNESCLHCLVDKDNAEVDTDRVLSVISQAAHLGFTSLAFSGGEPSIHPEFLHILTVARDYGFSFTLFTNATDFSDGDVASIAALSPEKVRISLYSRNPEVHDHLTQLPGSFEKTMRNIHLFKKYGVRLYINIPVTNKNYTSYQEVAQFCEEHGFERNFDPVVQPARDLRDRMMGLQLSYEQAKEVTKFQQSADILVANVKDGNIVCNAGADPSIDANLNVFPCPGVRISLGNLYRASLEDVLCDHPLIAELQSLDLSKLEACQKCEYLNGCYRCHGHGHQDAGSIYACSWYDKRQARIRQEIMEERGTLTIVGQ